MQVKKNLKKLLLSVGIMLALLSFFAVAINIYIIKSTEKYVFAEIADLPSKQAVLVLGAHVSGNTLSPVLQDRVIAGVEIYKKGKVKKILLSGDHGKIDYDEVNAMREFVLEQNPGIVKPEDIFMDHAGFDTYDSVVRAKEVFSAESLIIVTQKFHINRAVYLARMIGLDAVGFAVDETKYQKNIRDSWYLRESLSRVKAFMDILMGSKPKYLGEKIPLSGDGRKTNDK